MGNTASLIVEATLKTMVDLDFKGALSRPPGTRPCYISTYIAQVHPSHDCWDRPWRALKCTNLKSSSSRLR